MLRSSTDTSQLVQTLQGLMDRLSDPNLTAAEANDLHPRLLGLLDALGSEGCPASGVDRTASRVA